MLTVDEILVRPRITEKSTLLRENNGYVIEVHPSATKGDIKLAIQKKFKVNVLRVRTIKIYGKYRRRTGPMGGYQSDRKKAIVTLQPGQQIKWEEVAS
jgi:large subunit ribosomal protein L23